MKLQTSGRLWWIFRNHQERHFTARQLTNAQAFAPKLLNPRIAEVHGPYLTFDCIAKAGFRATREDA